MFEVESIEMEFSKADMRFFKEAHKAAECSDFKTQHVGAVIVVKKKIIGVGCNTDKTSPLQKEYNRYRNFNFDDSTYIKHSTHAEMRAIQSVQYVVGKEVDWSKASIYIYRICPGKKNGYGLSKPCEACMAAIKDLGIKNVYYTDDNGLAYLRLE